MNFGDLLLSKVKEAKLRIQVDLSRKVAFVDHLKFIYDCALATEQILKEASMAAYEIGDTQLAHYYAKHAEEEAGESQILMNDLKASQLVFPVVPNPTAMAIIGSQYYLLKHVHPICFLGYLVVAEADHVQLDTVEFLEEQYGPEMFTFLRIHATKDIEHAQEVITVVNNIPEINQKHVVLSATNALGYLAKAMKEIYG